MANVALLKNAKRLGENTTVALAGPVAHSLWKSLLARPTHSTQPLPTNRFFM